VPDSDNNSKPGFPPGGSSGSIRPLAGARRQRSTVPRLFHIAVLAVILAGAHEPALAHSESPQALEKSLRSTLESTFKHFGALHELLGLGPQAANDTQHAACVASKSCTLSAALDFARLSAFDLRDEAQGLQRDDTRLSGSYGSKATEAMHATIQDTAELTRLSRVLDSLKSNKSLVRKAPDLANAEPNLQPALQRTMEALHALLDYLNFSGVSTQDLQAALAEMQKTA
jgi:hypothetical protein